jgi:hypothetical protein
MRKFACLAAGALLTAFALFPGAARSAPQISPQEASFRFPAAVETPGDLLASGKSVDVWSGQVVRDDAHALSARVSGFNAGKNGFLLVLDSEGREVAAYEGTGPAGSNGDFWTPPVKGGRMALEYVAGSGATGFDISEYEAIYFDLDTVEARRAQAQAHYLHTRSAAVPAEGERVIYGADDRLDVYQVQQGSDPDKTELLELAQAACLVVFESELTNNGNGTFSLATDPWLTQGGSSLCASEPFRGQLQAGFCSGFLVGEDILVTAGHCVDSGDCGGVAFVFGFHQQGPSTPPNTTTIPANDVYFCSQVIDHALAGGEDHSVIRLDRTVSGHTPIPIRRGGNPPIGEPLVMVGHPVVLPLKIAGGAVVKTDEGPFISSNLDAYGGNSGSMVVSLNTFEIIGILVRGNADFTSQGGCTVSSMLSDNNSSFEEVSTTISFEQFIPELALSAGRLTMDADAYNCSATISFDLRDADLEGAGTQNIVVTAGALDTETVTLTETGADTGRFQGSLNTTFGVGVAENGTLEIAGLDEIITATYIDADNGEGGMNVAVTDEAVADCVAPLISNVSVTNLTGRRATITFNTNELASGTVDYGLACGALTNSASGGSTASHAIELSSLTPLTTYFFTVTATDPASNATTDDNATLCYSFTTLEAPTQFFTEQFTGTGGDNFDLDNTTLFFEADGSANFYGFCGESGILAFPTDPAGGTTLTLTDDGSASITPAQPVFIYGQSAASVFVNSNGSITFGAGDGTTLETFDSHFDRPGVSALFDDLNPASGGTVSWKNTADRLAVTWQNVREFSATNSNSFQIEMFFDGRIAITYLAVDVNDAVVGLSAGEGQPEGFSESNLGAFGGCVGGLGELFLDDDVYSCSDVVNIEVRDLDLAGTVSLGVTAETSGGDFETVTLLETGLNSAIFRGSIATVEGVAIPGNVVSLEVMDGETITVTYVDANDGAGGVDVDVVATAGVDCVAPVISNVATAGVQSRQASVTFDTDESATATVRFGEVCLVFTGTGSGSAATSHSVLLTGLTPNTTYFFEVEATDAAGNVTTDNNGGSCHSFTTLDAPTVFFTELFAGTGGDNFDLDNTTVSFLPDGSANYYRGCVEAASAFPTDPAGGTNITLTDDGSSAAITPSQAVSLYGVNYPSFFVNANGNITFDAADGDFDETVAEHFESPRVAALYDDLNPSQGGAVSRKETADRVAVTWQNVPQHSAGDSNSFQIELYFDGRVAITYLAVAANDGLVGLSAGEDTPAGFAESDLSAFGGCLSGTGEVTLDSDVYSCSDVVNIQVTDADLQGTVSLGVDVETTGGDFETVTLLEMPANSGIFLGSIATLEGVAIPGSVVALEVMDGETITVTYVDAEDDLGNMNVDVVATALTDCVAPVIANVAVSNVLARGATVTFETDESAVGTVNFGEICLTFSDSQSGPATLTHSIELTGLTPDTTYFFEVMAEDAAGNASTDNNGAFCYSFTTPEAQNIFWTEQFTGGGADDFDLDGQTLTLRPDGSINFYFGCVESASGFPTDPAGGADLVVEDDGSVEVVLTNGTVSVYGQTSASIFVGGNGYITFEENAGAGTASETFDNHFALTRVSGFYEDLNPEAGGTISVKETADRVAVTWQNVPEFESGRGGTGSHSFQVEMFFDGTIAITWQGVSQTDALVGVSAGGGQPEGFAEGDLSALGPCVTSQGQLSLDADVYSCADTIAIELRDADLMSAGTAQVTVSTTGLDNETVTLTETPADSGIFLGTLATSSGVAIAENAVLELAHEDDITALYLDADTGGGSPATVTDEATADCQGPVISNVMVVEITGVSARIVFETDDNASGEASYGLACGALSEMAPSAGTTAHSIQLVGLAELTTYFFAVSATDAVGNATTDDNGGTCYTFATEELRDYATEQFEGDAGNEPDLDFRTLTFSPATMRGTPSATVYTVCSAPALSFPTDPAGGTPLTLDDDGSAEVTLTGGSAAIFGQTFSSIFVNANGNITFDAADDTSAPTVADHFSALRVAGLFTDLDPESGGTISVRELADRVAVTYEDVPVFLAGGSNNMQIELFFDGTIAITHQQMDATQGIVGLSDGLGGGGTPIDFFENNLTAINLCEPIGSSVIVR